MLLTPERAPETGYWDKLYDAKDRNSIMAAYVTAVIPPKTLEDPAWELEFEEAPASVRGLVPFGETGLADKRLMNIFVEKEIKVKIKGIDKKNNIIACTRREVVEESKSRIIRMVKEGQEIEAMVSFATATLVGLDIGGGVLITADHRKTGISRTIPLSAVYQEGTVVRVSIQKVEENTGEIEIIVADPWKELHYARGAVLSCTVVHLGEKNIFVSARPGVVGIAPYPVNGGEKPELGGRLVFQVNEFNPSEKSLSLRYYDPEIIRGRKKNKAYWKRQRDRKKDQAEQAENQNKRQ